MQNDSGRLEIEPPAIYWDPLPDLAGLESGDELVGLIAPLLLNHQRARINRISREIRLRTDVRIAVLFGRNCDAGIDVARVIQRAEPYFVIGGRRRALQIHDDRASSVDLVIARIKRISAAGETARIAHLAARNQVRDRDIGTHEVLLHLETGDELIGAAALQHDFT